MAHSLSKEARTILAILNNCDELVSISNDRQRASDQMKALAIYARQKKFAMPEDKIKNYLRVILDSKPITLKFILQSIAQDVAASDKVRK